MLSFVRRSCRLLYLLCYVIAQHRAIADDSRSYEFSFNIVDFQHRYEKKDAEGIIIGEYGFITADGVYHETGYTTDKNGDFIITRQRNRRITSLKDAQEIFKDRPEAAKKLLEAVARACGNCKLLTKQEDDRTKSNEIHVNPTTELPLQKKMDPISRQMIKILMEKEKNINAKTFLKSTSEEKSKIVQERNGTSKAHTKNQPTEDVAKNISRVAKKLLFEENDKTIVSDRTVEKMANDLYYRFNYTITSHGHQEDGYRDGRKNGSYRSRHENGVDAQVRYLSNEFGHQPNITFVPRTTAADNEHTLKGYSFRWYWS